MLQCKNPGIIGHYELNEENKLCYLFMSLGPCIRGFNQRLLPVITIDASFQQVNQQKKNFTY